MPVELFKQMAPQQQAPSSPVTTHRIDAERSALMSQLLAQQGKNQDIRHPLHGVGHVFNSVVQPVVAAHGKNQEQLAQDAMIEQLSGAGSLSPFEQAALQAGYGGTVVQSRIASDNARRLAEAKAKLNPHGKIGANQTHTWNAETGRMEEIPGAMDAYKQRKEADAQIKDKYSDDGFSKLTSPVQKKLETVGNTLQRTLYAANTFKPEYAGHIINGLTNGWQFWLARKGYAGSQEIKDAQAWWQMWEKDLAMIERHEMFGSAFTKGEQESWNKATIQTDDRPDLVQAKIREKLEIVKSVASRVSQGLINSGQNPAVVSEFVGLTPEQIGMMSEHYKQKYAGDYGHLLEVGQEPAPQQTAAPQPNVPSGSGIARAAPTNQIKEGATATNPETGERLMFKGGKWQPM